MQLTKGAIGNLINRYKAVLKKCHLLNVFGSLAVAGMLVMGVADAAEAKYALDGAAYDVTVISDTELSFAPSGVAAGETRGSDDIRACLETSAFIVTRRHVDKKGLRAAAKTREDCQTIPQ